MPPPIRDRTHAVHSHGASIQPNPRASRQQLPITTRSGTLAPPNPQAYPVDVGPSLAYSPHQLKLVSSNWELQPDQAAPVLGDGADFAVIGVLGTPGTGKSSLCNALCDLTPAVASSGGGSSSAASGSTASAASAATGGSAPGARVGLKHGVQPFAERQPGSLQHCTSGVDLRVHRGDRLIVLDSQPLFSESALAALMAEGDRGLQPLATSKPWSSLHLTSPVPMEVSQCCQSLQMTAFLLLACHVVVVMVDSVDDLRVWSLLQAAEMLAAALPDVTLMHASSSTNGGGGVAATASGAGALQQQQQAAHVSGTGSSGRHHLAEVVFVLCNQHPDELQDAAYLRQQYELLRCLAVGTCLETRLGCINILREPPLVRQMAGGGRGGIAAAPQPQPAQLPQPHQQQQRGQAGAPYGDASSSAGSSTGVSGSTSTSASAGVNTSGDANEEDALPHVHFYALPHPLAPAAATAACSTISAIGAATSPGASGSVSGCYQRHLRRLCDQLLRHPRRPLARAAVSEREVVTRCWPRAWEALQGGEGMREVCAAMLRACGAAGAATGA